MAQPTTRQANSKEKAVRIEGRASMAATIGESH